MDLVSQNLLLTSGGKKDSTYVDDVFSTYLWWGNETARTIPTGVDNTEGALAWVKSRNDTHQHHLVDTERGSNKIIYSDSHMPEATIANRITGFTNNGFNVGSAGQVNGTNAYKYAGWNFRKQKGFFDIVTWTGNATNSSSPPRQIAHNLGSVPGAIWVKCLTAGQSWACYHKSLGATRYMHLSDPGAGGTSVAWWNNTEPTSTHFTVGYDGQVNENNQQYVAYVFAGGASTATGASSCSFNGTSGLDVAASSDVNFGTGTFCVEAWVYVDNLPGSGSPSYGRVFQLDGPTGNGNTNNLQITINPSNNTLHAWNGGGAVAIVGSKSLKNGQWHHIAVNRDSNNVITQYVDGIPDGTVTTATNFNPNSGSPRMRIGYYSSGNGVFDGKISNLRVTVGEPVYTAAFIPSKEPLTTTSQVTSSSNVKLLCCNVISNATGSTVTPGAIGNNGTNPVAYGNNPFDDPDGFKFGEDEDKGIIKMGSYIGNGSSTGPEINLGWEPQWVLIKASDRAAEWSIVDCIRGIVTGENDAALYPDATDAEVTSYDIMDVNATGFQLKTSNQLWNQNTKHYVYMAIRRPDGAVGKPAEAGTDAFTMDVGRDSSTIPNFDSGFPVDFAIARNPSATDNNLVGSRLTGTKYLITNSNTNGANSATGWSWDSNLGWNNHGSYGTSYLSWMWKRGAGFDVVTYTGNEYNMRQIPHSLGITPEMMWLKYRAPSGYNEDWQVYHKGLNGGVDPQDYAIRLDSANAEYNSSNDWADKAPTSTHFTIGGSDGRNNRTNSTYINMLFASVDGISKVGYYDGSDSAQTITTGFSPRFVIIKRSSDADNWFVLDTTRGYGSGNDQSLELDTTNAQSSVEAGAPTSTGFTVPALSGNDFAYGINGNGYKFIYYAHA
jgi:hypothetical protein